MSNIKDDLILNFQKLPGIGPKQAERFAYYLMKQNKNFIENLASNILNIKSGSSQCKECYSYFSKNENAKNRDLCDVCSDENRNKSVMMIVEKELDMNAIEKTKEYDGVYFVTGGKLPFLVNDPREYIRIRELVDTIRKKLDANNMSEIIFALPVNDEGDNQVEYIRKTVSQIVGMENIKISMLARGVSTGLEMEYIDHDTFKYAFNLRK